ncbi:hypothetical protein OS121_28475 [Mycolicibacterium mucogenicum]|uniref:hypothetical protein n=1 Tax=Mycolicibacterium mucogenicum TaxID=56689 RepID=UPI002269FE51|nr:hypothetical protein [Mycolicibacterium mucogenicum]MCX8558981.1 hypothetical protein [Mycolicibacterium mucogenicum]
MSTVSPTPEMGFTHIPVVHRASDNYKTYGTIVLDGVMSADQITELGRYLSDNNTYRPAAIHLPLNNISSEWHEMDLDRITIESTSWATPRFDELDEHPGTVQAFLDAVKAADARQWRIGPPILHVEITERGQDGWAGIVAALTELRDLVRSGRGVVNVAGLIDGVTFHNHKGRAIGRAWIDD